MSSVGFSTFYYSPKLLQGLKVFTLDAFPFLVRFICKGHGELGCCCLIFKIRILSFSVHLLFVHTKATIFFYVNFESCHFDLSLHNSRGFLVESSGSLMYIISSDFFIIWLLFLFESFQFSLYWKRVNVMSSLVSVSIWTGLLQVSPVGMIGCSSIIFNLGNVEVCSL